MAAFLAPLTVSRWSPRPAAISPRAPRCCIPPAHLHPHLPIDKSLPLDTALNRLHPNPSSLPAKVHLVGTGPGDPGLLTLHAVSLMQQADVVLYDRLVSNEILSFVRPSATMVYVGKQAGYHTRSQEEIQTLLATFAAPDKVVLRLKGGDPFIFGRGGEESCYLRERGIQVVVVPGITAAAGIAADLGIPLTQRAMATSVKFMTGHLREGVDVDVGAWDAEMTVVVYMGLGQLPKLVHDFKMAGMRDDTPVVAVERGTTKDQRVVVGRVEHICERVRNVELQSPTLVVVGEVVKLARVWDVGMGSENGLVVGGGELVREFMDEGVDGVREMWQRVTRRK